MVEFGNRSLRTIAILNDAEQSKSVHVGVGFHAYLIQPFSMRAPNFFAFCLRLRGRSGQENWRLSNKAQTCSGGGITGGRPGDDYLLLQLLPV
jgi:hypothetical protein